MFILTLMVLFMSDHHSLLERLLFTPLLTAELKDCSALTEANRDFVSFLNTAGSPRQRNPNRLVLYEAFEHPEHAHLPASHGHSLTFPPQLHFVFS